jgi:hypothetical protein
MLLLRLQHGAQLIDAPLSFFFFSLLRLQQPLTGLAGFFERPLRLPSQLGLEPGEVHCHCHCHCLCCWWWWCFLCR